MTASGVPTALQLLNALSDSGVDVAGLSPDQARVTAEALGAVPSSPDDHRVHSAVDGAVICAERECWCADSTDLADVVIMAGQGPFTAGALRGRIQEHRLAGAPDR